MGKVLRLAVAAAAAVVVSAASVAAVGGVTRGIAPGHTTRALQFASGGIGDANGDFVQVGLQTGTVSFRTRGGATVSEDGSVVTALAFTPDGIFGFGCWMVPPSMIDFNIQRHVTLRFDSSAQDVSECPGTPLGTALSAGPAPTLADSSIVGFIGRVAITATWVAPGSLDVRSTTINTTCGPFTALDQQDTRHFGGGPAMTVTSMTVEGTNPTTGEIEDVDLAGVAAVGPAFGDVSDTTENLVVNGPVTGSCGQFGS